MHTKTSFHLILILKIYEIDAITNLSFTDGELESEDHPAVNDGHSDSGADRLQGRGSQAITTRTLIFKGGRPPGKS